MCESSHSWVGTLLLHRGGRESTRMHVNSYVLHTIHNYSPTPLYPGLSGATTHSYKSTVFILALPGWVKCSSPSIQVCRLVGTTTLILQMRHPWSVENWCFVSKLASNFLTQLEATHDSVGSLAVCTAISSAAMYRQFISKY